MHNARVQWDYKFLVDLLSFSFQWLGFLMSIAALTEKKIDLQRTQKRKSHQISFGRSSELSAFVLIWFRSHDPNLDDHNEPLNSKTKDFHTNLTVVSVSRLDMRVLYAFLSLTKFPLGNRPVFIHRLHWCNCKIIG